MDRLSACSGWRWEEVFVAVPHRDSGGSLFEGVVVFTMSLDSESLVLINEMTASEKGEVQG